MIAENERWLPPPVKLTPGTIVRVPISGCLLCVVGPTLDGKVECDVVLPDSLRWVDKVHRFAVDMMIFDGFKVVFSAN